MTRQTVFTFVLPNCLCIHPKQFDFILNSSPPVDDFEFRTEQFLPVSTCLTSVWKWSLTKEFWTCEHFVTCQLYYFSVQYLESIFGLLFQLLQQVTECDTKMQVLHVISCVIERVNIQVRLEISSQVPPFLPFLYHIRNCSHHMTCFWRSPCVLLECRNSLLICKVCIALHKL